MKKPLKVLLIVLTALVFLVCAFLIWVNIGESPLADTADLDAKLQALSPQTVSLDSVKIYTQPDAYTCGVTAISVVVSYCRQGDILPESLIDKYKLGGGMQAGQFVDILSKELPDYIITYRPNLGDAEMISQIQEQLAQGMPVPVFFGAANPYNKPNYDFHASVVTGIDLQTRQVKIANVYGYEEDIPLTEFLDRMAYRGGNYPLVQKTVVKLGLMEKNAIISIVKK